MKTHQNNQKDKTIASLEKSTIVMCEDLENQIKKAAMDNSINHCTHNDKINEHAELLEVLPKID